MRQKYTNLGVLAIKNAKINDFTSIVEHIFGSLDISENTRKEYQSRIQVFLQFLKQNGFSENSYLDFKQFLKEKHNYSVSTKNKYLISAKVFLKELHQKRFLESDITQNIKGFIQQKKHRKDGLNESEIIRIFNYLKKQKNTNDIYRLRAIFCLLALQGLRQIEIVRLVIQDIDIKRKIAFINGKGRDDKEPVHLHPQTVKVLFEYIQAYQIKDGPLFISQSNNSKNQGLTTKSIRGFIMDLLKELDIEKTVHGFRHYFTTCLVQSYKGDLLRVAQYTRHKSLEMLQVYYDGVLSKEDLPRYYETFNKVQF